MMAFDCISSGFNRLFKLKGEAWKRSKGKRGGSSNGSIVRSSHVASRRYHKLLGRPY